MNKKILSAILAALMLLTMTACNQGGETEGTGEAGANADTGTRYFPTEFIYEIVTTGQEQKAEYTYDEDWNLIRLVMTMDGTEAGIVDYEVDEHGNLVKQTNTVNGMSQAAIYENTYDESGNLIQQAQSVDGQTAVLTQAEYDENGNQTYAKTTQYNAYGFMVNESWFDANGNVTREAADYGDGSSSVTEYTYDDAGNLLTTTTTDVTGTSTSVCEYADGRLSRVTDTNSFGEVSQYALYSYEGNVTTCTTCDGRDNMTGKTVETYDDAGNLLQREYYGPEGELYYRSTWIYVEVPAAA